MEVIIFTFIRRYLSCNFNDAMAGISANFLTLGKIEAEVKLGNDNEIETIDKIYGLKKFYVSGMAGIGLDYNNYLL